MKNIIYYYEFEGTPSRIEIGGMFSRTYSSHITKTFVRSLETERTLPIGERIKIKNGIITIESKVLDFENNRYLYGASPLYFDKIDE